MQPHTEPCPLCGKNKDEYERKREQREIKRKEMIAFIVGRRSVSLFSRRENDIFDAFFYLGIKDFKQIADNYGISVSSVETYYDRAMEKLLDLEFEL